MLKNYYILIYFVYAMKTAYYKSDVSSLMLSSSSSRPTVSTSFLTFSSGIGTLLYFAQSKIFWASSASVQGLFTWPYGQMTSFSNSPRVVLMVMRDLTPCPAGAQSSFIS